MKKYSIFLSATLVLFALASCQKEAETNVPEVQKGFIPFELKADIDDSAGMTKTSLNPSTKAVNWVDGDIIYAVTTDKLWGQDYKDDNSGASIAEFTYDESTDKFTTTSEIAAGAHTFNFLYSNGAQKSYHRGSSTTFQLYSNQTYDVSNPCANIKAYDALAAQLTVTTPATLTGITMKHLFTLMKVTIKNKTGADVNVTKFELIAKTGTYLYGVFDVTFGATPTVAYNKNGGTTIATVISNGTIANNGTIDIYFVMAPLTSYTGDITFRVTDDADNTYSRTNTISSALTLAAGSLNSATHTLTTPDAVDPLPTINTSSTPYSTDFETGFEASTTYNNTEIRLDGPDGQKWGTYYGTTSTSDAINGTNSVQMRWYTSTTDRLGYAETQFYLSTVGYVSFNAKATNGLKLGLYYKTSDGSWTLAQTFTPGTSTTPCSYSFDTPLTNVRLRIAVVLPATNPSSNSRLTFDDFFVSSTEPLPTISVSTVAASSLTSATGSTATLNGSLSLLNGAVIGSLSSAGFYYKASGAGSFTKVTCSPVPTSTSFSYNLTELTAGTEYTFKAWGIYDSGDEVLGSELTFTPVAALEAIYTITSKTAVSVSGTAPAGSTAAFSTTYSNMNQLTKDNSMTLTLHGYSGKKITGIKLSMKSNASAGAGTFSAVAGATTLASISSATGFNSWYDNKSYGTSYRDVNVTLTNSLYTIGEEDVVITITATTNSLYCQSFSITYE